MTAVTSFRTCPLCEATCGLAVTVTPGEPGSSPAIAVRGDRDDVFSRGYLCPKGVALGELHDDPDRLRTPLVRRDGVLVPATWEEAYAAVGELLRPIVAEHGPNAVAVYLGNPNVHNVASTLYAPALVRALRTRYRFSASTVDQMPKQVAAGLMFGTELSVAVPDVDRTDYLLVLGANPMVSNGSLLTAPDLPGRLRALRRRGGRLVVVDPRRSRTAEVADEHVPLRPGSDALLLAAMASTLFAEGLVDLGDAEPWVVGLSEVERALAPFTPAAVAGRTGVPAATTVRLARELAAAPSAAVYGRIGTCTTEHGTVASWLVDVLNTLTGNLDRPGGVLWPLPAAGGPTTSGAPGSGRGVRVPGSGRTRVRQAPSVFGEFPAATLAEEIDTPGAEGEHVRALITLAGNPALSTPNATRLAAALSSLDALVCVDVYLNETSRSAHVVLPPASPLARSHYDVVFSSLAVRNVANYSPPTLPLQPGEKDEADILLRLAAIAAGISSGPDDPASPEDQVDAMVAAELAGRLVADPSSRVHALDPADLLEVVAGRRRVERLLDMLLRAGPYGAGLGGPDDGLTLATLEASPHGVDLGPLAPRLPEVLRTPSGRVELAPVQVLQETARLAATLGDEPAGGFVLVGRRQLRSNNSWLHNLPLLSGGTNRCTLQLHPEDAAGLDVVEGGEVLVRSRVGELRVPAEITDAIMRGVVSLPHGWGHGLPGSVGAVAAEQAGVNSNVLTDEVPVDALSGNAVLTGIPVTLERC